MRRYSSRYGRYVDDEDTSDNAGQVSIDTSGDLSIGIGGGLGIDTANGDLTVQIAPGVSIDTGMDPVLTTMAYRVLVAGSRVPQGRPGYRPLVHADLDQMAKEHGTLIVVHGCCPTGADDYADEWVRLHAAAGHRVERHPADWSGPCAPSCPPRHRRRRLRTGTERYCPAAGPRRNQEMAQTGADECRVYIVNGSRGATGMARLAEQAGIRTKRRVLP